MNPNKRVIQTINKICELKDIYYPKYSLPIEYLTIFSQSEEDFNTLRDSLIKIGKETKANNGFKYALQKPIIHQDEKISLVRIRKPDIHRKELGCADLEYQDEDYKDLRRIALDNGLDIILRKGYEMIELSDFNINVYAYLVKDI